MVIHFHGCNGEPNRLNRIYHSDETEDGTWSLYWLERGFGHAPTATVGYLLGGNILACLLAKKGNDILIDVAVIVSVPFVLKACSYYMNKGSSWIYQHYLLSPLKANTSRRLEAYPGSLLASPAQLKFLCRIRSLNDLITAKIHGFADAIDYYRQCGAIPLLSRIAKPTLIIHARDSLFMDHHVIPKPKNLPSQAEYQLIKHGGHVGFIGGTVHRPETWLELKIPD